MTASNFKFAFFGNGRLAVDILRWLVSRGDRPAALIAHPSARARERENLLAIAGLHENCVFEAPGLDAPATQTRIEELRLDFGVSVLFGYRIGPGILRLLRNGCVNLHPSLLPYNRGANPNVWSIVDRTPAGVTLHYMDSGIDTGPIIAQTPVEVKEVDTGGTLYAKLEHAAYDLFTKNWSRLPRLAATGQAADAAGTTHRVADLADLDRIAPDRSFKAGELIDILRARTFPPYRGAFLDLPDRRIYLSLTLEQELKPNPGGTA